MEKKRLHIVTIICFAAFIGVLSLWNVAAPKRTVSWNENRTLAAAPDLSASHIFGGRFDHTVGALQTIAFLAEQGAAVYAFEQTPDLRQSSYITALKNGTMEFPETAEGYLSLIAWGGDARGVTLEHLQYPLCDDVLKPHIALGISNTFLPGMCARVTVRDGLLLVVKPR